MFARQSMHAIRRKWIDFKQFQIWLSGRLTARGGEGGPLFLPSNASSNIVTAGKDSTATTNTDTSIRQITKVHFVALELAG